MTKQYNQDLRDKVIAFMEAGNKAPLASKVFSLAVGTVRAWHKRYQEEGHCCARKRVGKQARLTEDLFSEHIAQFPHKTLEELGEDFSMTGEGIRYYIKKFGYSYKKKSLDIVKRAKKNKKNILNA